MADLTSTDGSALLTRRESEIAALVAEGLTNREIAERLFISERTADGHLEHIREKLGVRNRAQITAWHVARAAGRPVPIGAVGEARVASLRRGAKRRWPVAGMVLVLGAAAVLSGLVVLRNGATGAATAVVAGSPGEAGAQGDFRRATAAQLRRPVDVAVGTDGRLYIADFEAGRVRAVDQRGVISTVAGGGSAPLTTAPLAAAAEIGHPSGVAVGPSGSFYVTSELGVLWVRADGTVTVLAAPESGGLKAPAGIAVGRDGGLFVADPGANVVFRLFPGQRPAAFAGTGEARFFGDGGAAASAGLSRPTAVAIDPRGDLFIADTANNRIRMVEAGTGIIRTVAGSRDLYGDRGDGGPATEARLSLPEGVAVDGRGTVYVADTGNNRVRAVRDGRITTVMGTGVMGFAGGPALHAQLWGPEGLAIGADGELYIADTANRVVRRLPTGAGQS